MRHLSCKMFLFLQDGLGRRGSCDEDLTCQSRPVASEQPIMSCIVSSSVDAEP